MKRLLARTEDMLEYMLGWVNIPPKNCSCHLDAPCNDCVDNAHDREMEQQARQIILELKSAQLILPDEFR